MSKSTYKNITFAKGYNKTLGEFEKEFGNVACFKRLQPKARKAEMKKVHKRVIAENKAAAKAEAEAKAAEEAKDSQEPKDKSSENGDTTSTTSEGPGLKE